ncbi:YdaS family helix-turn-helix protein [uncultured Sphingomonas sp.]|uniref:transcriptional regulator n=1 Tax=uncultured Sphingomonas sp. TaxID=158754 RepID=UPI0025CFB59E|nr:YdaS family helix-turn-helix protein [uncultured Sphingomonas sp.]
MGNALRFDPGLEVAIGKAGGVSALARLLGRKQQTVSSRLHAGRKLWPEDVLKVEAATGISRHDLRPDLYPREATARPVTDLGELEPAR